MQRLLVDGPALRQKSSPIQRPPFERTMKCLGPPYVKRRSWASFIRNHVLCDGRRLWNGRCRYLDIRFCLFWSRRVKPVRIKGFCRSRVATFYFDLKSIQWFCWSSDPSRGIINPCAWSVLRGVSAARKRTLSLRRHDVLSTRWLECSQPTMRSVSGCSIYPLHDFSR
jgi:hypothetical protein